MPTFSKAKPQPPKIKPGTPWPAPKVKPPTPAAAALVAIASSAAEELALPGNAPWREDLPIWAPRKRAIEIRKIIAIVAAEFEITPEQLRGNYRTRKFVFPRHVAQYLAQRVTRQSLPIIGRAFYRDHTSVLSAIRKIGRMIDEDPAKRELVDRLEARIRGIAANPA